MVYYVARPFMPIEGGLAPSEAVVGGESHNTPALTTFATRIDQKDLSAVACCCFLKPPLCSTLGRATKCGVDSRSWFPAGVALRSRSGRDLPPERQLE
jgi:hypothetical protein